jgi:hypothetical protein
MTRPTESRSNWWRLASPPSSFALTLGVEGTARVAKAGAGKALVGVVRFDLYPGFEHQSGDDRTRQRAAPGFIHPGDETGVFGGQTKLTRKARHSAF